MSNLNLPSNVKLDPNTGLYVITNRDGNTFRVRASTQDQLDTYVQSVNTNFPALVNTTDSDGNPVQQRFDPEAITAQQNSLRAERALQAETKRATGLIGNRDGTYTDLRTNQTITKEQAEVRIAEAGLPPAALQSITPKNSPTYAAAESAVANVTQLPSNQTSTNGEQPNQAQSGVGQGQTASSPVSLGQNSQNQTSSVATTAAANVDLPPALAPVQPAPTTSAVPVAGQAQPAVQAAPVNIAPPPLTQTEANATSPLGPPNREPAQVTERTLDPAAGEGPNTVVVNSAPAQVDINRLPGGDAALFASATAPGEVDPAFAAELESLRRAQEEENVRAARAAAVPTEGDEAIAAADRAQAEQEAAIGEMFGPKPVPPSLAGIKASRDDFGNLLPGWAYSDDEGDYYVGDNYIDPSIQASAAATRANLAASQTRGLTNSARNQSTLQARVSQPAAADWRVRLSLAANATYLYKDNQADILAPLAATDGVIFPYTPSIETSYKAKYNAYDLVHSNYRGYFYQNSNVEEINIKGTFTAQDTREAAYLLAVIHFFRSVTKMFYGQDAEAGAPPPLCFLTGLGQYQFNKHPVLVSSFNYALPTDVDYIRANGFNNMGLNLENRRNQSSGPGIAGTIGTAVSIWQRLSNSGLNVGATSNPPSQSQIRQNVTNQNSINSTYVPTKMDISITLLPIQTRDQVSKQFSVKSFARGDLLKGGFW